jgi:hypothetical protein
VLELGGADGRRTVDRDTEIAVEELCDHLSQAVARLVAAGDVDAPELGPPAALRLRRH